MRVLFVIEDLGSGGAQRQMVNLALLFKKRGHEVVFLIHNRNYYYLETLKQGNISVSEVIDNNKLKRLYKIRNFIRSGKYDTVVSFLQSTSFMCEIASLPTKNWKLIVGERSANPAILSSLRLIVYRIPHFFANHVVANSFENLNYIKRVNPFLNKSKLHVIYNMVDFSKWSPHENVKSSSQGIFNLTIAASHRFLKNLNGLVEAVNLLSNDEKNRIQINWYGSNIHDDSKSLALEKIARYGLERIFNFHDSTLDIHIKVQNADAVGLFSFYEGLPNIICEAMAAGKPIICSQISDIPKIIMENENGFLCDPSDSESIRASISKILHCDNETLHHISQNNVEKARKLFDPDIIYESYNRLMLT